MTEKNLSKFTAGELMMYYGNCTIDLDEYLNELYRRACQRGTALDYINSIKFEERDAAWEEIKNHLLNIFQSNK